jgi:MoaA/NifB/PqqE/SkfB family radical SAM enzyme
LRAILKKEIPGQLVIQMTDQCNAACPQCGMRVTEEYQRTSLDTERIKKILDAAAQHGIRVVSFTGGEPLLHMERLIQLIDYAGNLGIQYIRTGTNGFIFRNSHKPGFNARIRKIAAKLARTPLRNFWISIDSADPETHEKMRGFEGIMQGIEKALPIFHEYGLYPSANLGINRNVGGRITKDLTPKSFFNWADYDAAFLKAYRLSFTHFYQRVIRMGFTIVNTCYPMSISSKEEMKGLKPVYAATSIGDIIRFSRREKELLFKALLEVIPKFRSKIRIFTPLCALHSLSTSYNGANPKVAYGCRGGIDFFFVDARKGRTYPCGYRGNEDFGDLWDLNLKEKSFYASQECRQCDWECFRDPSELFGPFLDGIANPLGLSKRVYGDFNFFKLWGRDLRYYKVCDLFDGRKAPRYQRMQIAA